MKKCILFILFSLVVSGCVFQSDSYKKHVRDTVVTYDINNLIEFNGYTIYSLTSSYMLNSYLYLCFSPSESEILYLYDTNRDTVMSIDISSDSECCNREIENFINYYYNFYPLSEKDLEVIIKVIKYSYFWVYSYNSFAKQKDFGKMRHFILNTINDSINFSYNIELYDTIFDVKSNFKLKFLNKKYKIILDNSPKTLIRNKIFQEKLHQYYI